MSALPGSAEGTAVTGLDSRPVEPAPLDLPPLTEQTRLEAREIMARYPVARSALLPMLHLVQSVQGYVSPEGVGFCARLLGLTKAEVGAVATFYTMYKRRPTGRHLVSVCTNTLCSVLGGQRIMDALSADLGVHHDETAADGSITLEHAECLAACDYAPIVTVNYEFFDNQTVTSAHKLVNALREGERPMPTRGAPLCSFKQIERQIAGFHTAETMAPDANTSGVPTEIGVHLAVERGESAPSYAVERTDARTAEASAARAASQPTSAHDAPLETSASDEQHPQDSGGAAEPEPGKGT
jgi:NADH-quinone oxidoreductase subunit E